MPTTPVDGRRQFSQTEVILGNVALGRAPMAGVQQIGPDRYVLAGSWPTPRPVSSGPVSGPVSSASDDRPMTPARALWPNLR
jgi:hypothetical protein